MAQTAADVQAQLGTNMMGARILRSYEPWQGTDQQWLVKGGVDAGGRVRLVSTTAEDSAAVQAAAILTALRA